MIYMFVPSWAYLICTKDIPPLRFFFWLLQFSIIITLKGITLQRSVMQRVVFIFIMASHPASLHLYSLEFWYLGDSVVVWLFFQTPQLVAAGIVVGGSMRKEKIVGLKKSSFLVRMTPCKHRGTGYLARLWGRAFVFQGCHH